MYRVGSLLADFHREAARLSNLFGTIENFQPTVVLEVAVMSLAIEQMDFVACRRCVEHSVLGEVIVRTFPIQDVADKLIVVLFGIGLFLTRHKQNDLVAIPGCHNATSEGLVSRVSPKFCQSLP